MDQRTNTAIPPNRILFPIWASSFVEFGFASMSLWGTGVADSNYATIPFLC
jgi:hypothetical protein